MRRHYAAAAQDPARRPAGPPLLLVTCIDPVTSSAAAPATLHLPPDAMHAARVGAGEVLLVSVARGRAAWQQACPLLPRTAMCCAALQHTRTGAGVWLVSLAHDGRQLCLQVGVCAGLAAPAPTTPAARSPAPTSPATPTGFGPAPHANVDLATVSPADLWQQQCRCCGCSLEAVAGVSGRPAARADAPGRQLLGRFLATAKAWPGAKLAKGTAAPSSVLWSALAQPAPGCSLVLYRASSCPAAAAASGAVAATALLMCHDSLKTMPVVVPAPLSSSSRTVSAGPGGTPGRSSGGMASPSTPGSARGGRAAQRPPSGLDGGASAAAAARQAAEQWPLQLLGVSIDWTNSQQVGALACPDRARCPLTLAH